MATSNRHIIPGSDKAPLPNAKPVSPTRKDERLEVTVRLRRKLGLSAASAPGALDDRLPAQRQYLSREAFAAQHVADPADIAKVDAFAKANNLAVVGSYPARRSIVLSGTAEDFAKAFEVELHDFEHDSGTYRGRSGSISVPSDLADIVEAVLGLDNRPQAQPNFRRYHSARGLNSKAAESFSPTAIAKLYDFPTGVDGTGQCIALIELGGGFKPKDIATYFKGLGLKTPKVTAVLVDHGSNHPTNSNSADGEVMLDIEVAAAVAPGASIVVYFAPNTDQGFLDAISTAVHDTTHKPSVISISWGSAESSWTTQSMTQFDQAFQAAATMGVTVCVAAGDNGSADGATDGEVHVDFPASSPYALGCGGTRLTATSSGTGISSEVVWNEGVNSATGGGVSGFFALPAWQAQAKVPKLAGKTGRGVPDVAGDADPNSGYNVLVDGDSFVIGGTSAVAPLWAGLIALINQQVGKPVGYLNPLLYGSLAGKGLTRDITSGNNGAWKAATGWDACTGWGSPIGAKLAKALAG